MFREYKTRGGEGPRPGSFFCKTRVAQVQNPGLAKIRSELRKFKTRVAHIERPAELIQSIEMNVTEWAGTDTAPSLTGSDVSYGFTRSCPISL